MEMKANSPMLALITLATVLGSTLASAAPETTYRLPDEVKAGSIRVMENRQEDEASLLKLARITRQQAESAALAVQPGKVVKARLDDEEGFLVWQVDVRHGNQATEFSVDAGNGKVIAAEAEEDDDHDLRR
jgi:uncharacterized membrane protein YkoI